MGRVTVDHSGKRIGMLTVISKTDKKTKQGNVYYLCRCDCGNETLVHSGNIGMENTKSCGCYRVSLCKETKTKHGLRNSRIYKTYMHVISRCYNPKDVSYKYYGAKGVTVCDEWRTDRNSFFQWALLNGYSDSLTIERIDPFKGYSPNNCTFISLSDQQRNRRCHQK